MDYNLKKKVSGAIQRTSCHSFMSPLYKIWYILYTMEREAWVHPTAHIATRVCFGKSRDQPWREMLDAGHGFAAPAGNHPACNHPAHKHCNSPRQCYNLNKQNMWPIYSIFGTGRGAARNLPSIPYRTTSTSVMSKPKEYAKVSSERAATAVSSF